ncbi:hypothetical protein AgCh_012031 [Apium graveolens]
MEGLDEMGLIGGNFHPGAMVRTREEDFESNSFKENPHPDEKQRLELGKRLSLENKQVKFWFQNKQTQMKTQLEHHENLILKQENDKLRIENITIKEAMRNPICSGYGGLGPAEAALPIGYDFSTQGQLLLVSI